MICIQKIYGFHGLSHQIIEESWDVRPVTYGWTDGGKWKIGQCSGKPETARMSVCITKKHFYNTFASCITCSVVLWKTRKTKLFRIYKVAPISIIAATVFSIIAQFCVATIMFYNTLATIMFFNTLATIMFYNTLATIMFFNSSPRRRRNPLPVQFVTCPPPSRAIHPTSTHPHFVQIIGKSNISSTLESGR